MISIRKIFPIRLLVIVLMILGVSSVVFAAGGPPLVKPRSTPGMHFYAGTITKISGSSITLYHGATCIITASTACKAPASPMSARSMMSMQTVPCSSFVKGETVLIAAVRNVSGQLVAVKIKEAFF
ncbi:hypothetical protein ACMCNP_05025 [Candidatus Acidulodesulfobacterium sp. H_13]|uniref:hypothetical protein n=1 Tax=Candidatus Acidulodesulfobacterium sp. H_13 TaxID=3395470 RepID=UPI003AF71178